MACPGPPPGITMLCSPDLEARSKALTGFIALSCASAVIGCGGGARQDADEPEGNFDVAVVSATFPKQQKLAQTSQLVITVENTGKEAVPNLAVTVDGLNYRATQPNLANPERPRFAVTGIPRQIGGFPEAKDATPLGCDTAYVNTWACGPLKPGKQTKLVWPLQDHLARRRRAQRQGQGRHDRRRGADRLVRGHGLARRASGAHRRRRQDGRHRVALT
jgi:hypothetical protein